MCYKKNEIYNNNNNNHTIIILYLKHWTHIKYK